ncbi:MAG TPA: hypothetical protein DET40_19205 [Lentisphaeria bacterium]|nr:MAG: hypothetical protein A2X45_18035 [Lentisphaerae bacterium GWF2_50_93]HCE45676.1 hypothetical protein [Lentisphaeria bacterium]
MKQDTHISLGNGLLSPLRNFVFRRGAKIKLDGICSSSHQYGGDLSNRLLLNRQPAWFMKFLKKAPVNAAQNEDVGEMDQA